jgi:hypothetical protein
MQSQKQQPLFIMTFKRPLDLRDNGDMTFTLLQDFTYKSTAVGAGITIYVPKGFRTDFASVPRIFWAIFPPYGRHGKAAVIHDYLYGLVRIKKFNRAVADSIFLACMKELGVSWWRRYTMYLAVRCWGWYAVRQTWDQSMKIS